MQSEGTEPEEEGALPERPQALKDRTTAFASRIIRMYPALPEGPVARVLGKQALQSGTSAGANYREANRGRSRAEFIAKMGERLKEPDETEYWLVLLIESGIVTSTRMAGLIDETNQLTAIFVTVINNSKA